MSGDCEYLVRTLSKVSLPPQTVIRCSLTRKCCFCEGRSSHLCTRRTFALDYEKRHPEVKGESINPAITD